MSKNNSYTALICLCLAATCSITAFAETPRRLDGAVSKDKLADALSSCGIKCIFQEGTDAKLIVDTVHMGSDAYYSGLTSGDVIQMLVAADGKLSIAFKRGANNYQVSLPLSKESALNGTYNLTASAQGKGLVKSGADRNDAQLKNRKAQSDKNNQKIVDVGMPSAPIVDVGRNKMPIVDVDSPLQLQSSIQRLAQYNIELIIDRTGSMAEIDGTDGLTKYEWCHQQVRDLARRLSPYQARINITTFNTTFQTYPNCTLDQVEQVYSNTPPGGETDLVDPLMSRLTAAAAIWHKGAKPTLIAVIHDGMPNVPADTYVVDRAIINFTKTMSDPNEVSVTFLQIGDKYDGRDFCNRLDTNLVPNGAKFDIVHTVDFQQLKRTGLINALISTILSNSPRQNLR